MVPQGCQRLVAAGVTPGDRICGAASQIPLALAIYGGAVAAGLQFFLPLNRPNTAPRSTISLAMPTPKLLLALSGARAVRAGPFVAQIRMARWADGGER